MTPRDLGALVLLAAIWGASFLFQRVAAPAFGPVPLVAMRVGIAAVILGALLASRGQLRQVRAHWKVLLLLGAINTAIPFSLFAFATLHVTAGIASVLNGTVPLWAAAIGRLWYGERLDGARATGLALGFLGVVVLVWKDGGTAAGPGVAAGLAAAFLYAVAAHLSRRRLGDVDAMVVAGGSQAGAAILILGPALTLAPGDAPPVTAWWSAVLLGVFCTALAYLLFFGLIARVGAMRAMTVSYLIPVFGMLWGWLLLSEPITGRMVAGGVLVLVGVAFTTGVWQPVTRSGRAVTRGAMVGE